MQEQAASDVAPGERNPVRPRLLRSLTVALFAAAACVYSIRMTSPFSVYAENVTAAYAIWAQNYLKFGYTPSGFASIQALAPTLENGTPEPHHLYSHRPPFVLLLISLFFQIFGAGEGTIRAVGVLASLVTLAVFLAVGVRLLGRVWGTVAAAFFAFIPNFAFYGPMIAVQTFGLLGALLIVLFYLRWIEAPTRRNLVLLCAITAACCLTVLNAYYAAGGVGLVHLIRKGPKRWVGLLVPGCAIVSFLCFLLYTHALDPEGGKPIADMWSAASVHSQAVPVTDYVTRLVRTFARWFTLPVLILTVVGLIRMRPRSSVSDAVLLSTAFLGVETVIFVSMVSGHMFVTVHWIAFLALLAARGLQVLIKTRLGLAGGGVLLGLFLLQSSYVLYRGHQDSAFPYYAQASRALAEALNRQTSAGDRILVRLYHDRYITYYYSERELANYSPEGRLKRHYDAQWPGEEMDEESLIHLLKRPGHGFDWVVTTSYSLARETISALRSLPARVADPEQFTRDAYYFESETQPTKLGTFLKANFPSVVRDGFLFFDTRDSR